MASDRQKPRKVVQGNPVVDEDEIGASDAAQRWRPELEIGMYVRDSAETEIGRVKEIRGGDFLVERHEGEMLAVSYDRIEQVDGDRIDLDRTNDDLDVTIVRPSPLVP